MCLGNAPCAATAGGQLHVDIMCLHIWGFTFSGHCRFSDH